MLSISNLTKSYQSKKQSVLALDDVSLTIEKGMFGLLGANGAGKSSLMRTIASLQKPDAGEISFKGHDVLAKPEFIREQLGYLPQEFGVYAGVSAYDLLDYLAKLKGIGSAKQRHQQIEHLLADVNLTEHKNRAVDKFSGGMKQRFGIAQALLGEPDLIIVDEPTAGLDPEERNRFHNLLANISEDKVVLLSTHIVEDVSNLCPNMAILAQGKVVTTTSPQSLIESMHGKIWQITTKAASTEQLMNQFQVINQRLSAGEMTLEVFCETSPGSDFELVMPDLESAYFACVHSQKLVLGSEGAQYD